MHNNRYAIVLGMFDGMHIGHRALVESAVAFARKNGCKSMVYTFENHPLAVLGRDPGLLMTVEERTEIMKKLGVDEVVMFPFSREFAAIQPEDFLQKLLDEYGMCAAFAGFNYTFGDKGKGDEPLLRKFGEEHGFHVSILPPVLYKEEFVSSSRIRKAILDGDMKEAASMLGEPYFITGHLENREEGSMLFCSNEKKVLPPCGEYPAMLCEHNRSIPVRTEIMHESDFMAVHGSVPQDFGMASVRICFAE